MLANRSRERGWVGCGVRACLPEVVGQEVEKLDVCGLWHPPTQI